MNRPALIDDFLARNGYGSARVLPLAPDASFRRYLRLMGGPRPAILMDAPPPEDVGPFLRIAGHLSGAGLSAPVIFAADEVNGLVLEEDWGDGLLTTLPPFAAPDARAPDAATLPATIAAAVDALVAVQRAAPPPGLSAWDSAAMAQTAAANLLDWWWPAQFGEPAPEDARSDFARALAAMLQPLAAGPRCFVHRDFFGGNLIWLSDRAAPRNIGILDFQSAAIGHPAYDLVSLLQDARNDVPGDIEAAATARFLALRPELDPDEFRAAYAICAAQRHLRVACQWVRLALRDKRPHYLAYGPRTWRLLGAALHHPSVAPLAAALHKWVPPALRGNPEGLVA